MPAGGSGVAKNRHGTEEAILEAVTRIVEERGFGALGVNSVAEKAGVAKMLIYRYFGSYQGLLEEWALRHSYWADGVRDLERHFEGAPETREFYAGLLKSLLESQVRTLRENTVKREVLRWFLAEKNEVAAKVMERIEERGVEVSRMFRSRVDTEEDVEAMVSVIISGLNYLALIADRADVFNSVPLDTEAGWTRIGAAVGRMVDMVLIGDKNEN
jgi:AcrR family transcriptional regulator